MENILITNDDGIFSEGLVSLAKALEPLGEVWVVAPDRQRNATSRSLTLDSPLRVEQLRPRWFSVTGTPVDCVTLAIKAIMKQKPALIASGINKGANVGIDIAYSGTVSAAIEGACLGINSFAISLAARDNFCFQPAAQFAQRVAHKLLKRKLPPFTVLNINIPDTKGKSISNYRITKQCSGFYNTPIDERTDPRGNKYYWIGQGNLKIVDMEDSDLEAINEGIISITPLYPDLTCYFFIEELKDWEF